MFFFSSSAKFNKTKSQELIPRNREKKKIESMLTAEEVERQVTAVDRLADSAGKVTLACAVGEFINSLAVVAAERTHGSDDETFEGASRCTASSGTLRDVAAAGHARTQQDKKSAEMKLLVIASAAGIKGSLENENRSIGGRLSTSGHLVAIDKTPTLQNIFSGGGSCATPASAENSHRGIVGIEDEAVFCDSLEVAKEERLRSDDESLHELSNRIKEMVSFFSFIS